MDDRETLFFYAGPAPSLQSQRILKLPEQTLSGSIEHVAHASLEAEHEYEAQSTPGGHGHAANIGSAGVSAEDLLFASFRSFGESTLQAGRGGCTRRCGLSSWR